MLLSIKHLRNESVFETKVKLFFILKLKDFNLQTKMKVFPKRKYIVLETKMFLFRKHLQNGNVFETKVKLKRLFVFFCVKKKSRNENFLGWHVWATILVRYPLIGNPGIDDAYTTTTAFCLS